MVKYKITVLGVRTPKENMGGYDWRIGKTEGKNCERNGQVDKG
jgi:hypothetical protein